MARMRRTQIGRLRRRSRRSRHGRTGATVYARSTTGGHKVTYRSGLFPRLAARIFNAPARWLDPRRRA